MRISLFGGGTDRPEWFREHGGEVLGFSIDKYCWISLRRLPPFFDYKHRLVYSSTELVDRIDDIQHPVIRAVFRERVSCGLELHHDGDLPARSGLGSSSSFTVGLLNALKAFDGHRASPTALATEAIHIERDVLGETVGSQDQVWAAHGGFNRIVFHKDESYTVHPVVLSGDAQRELQAHLMLFFTGFPRLGEIVAREQVARFEEEAWRLRFMQDLVGEAATSLAEGRVEAMGGLLNVAWSAKRGLADGVSTPEIDEIYAAARDAGATGGKLLGAGGGGFMLLFAPPSAQARIRERLSKLIEVQFKIGSPGSQIVLYEPEGL